MNDVAEHTAPPVGGTETVPPTGESGVEGTHGDRALAVAVPLLILALAAWVVLSSLGLGYWTPIGPGPGFFPLWLAVLLGVMSVVWLLQVLRGRTGRADASAENAAASTQDVATPESQAMGAPHEEPLNLKHVLAVLVSLILVTALLEVIGFQLSMFLFLLFQLRVLARRGWRLSLGLSVLFSFGVFTVFTQLLRVNLPTASITLLRSMGL